MLQHRPESHIERKTAPITEYLSPADPDLARIFLFQYERKQPMDIVTIRKERSGKRLAVFVYQDWLVT